MGLARWILVNGAHTSWWLLPDADNGAEGAPSGPWNGRAVRLETPLLTRPLRLASKSPPAGGELSQGELTLWVDVSQVADAPGPAALREDAGDDEWHHALDELLGAMATVAEAGGFTPLALGVTDHRIDARLKLSRRGAGHEGNEGNEGNDRLLLVAHAWRLLGLSRGLALEAHFVDDEGLDVLLAGGSHR